MRKLRLRTQTRVKLIECSVGNRRRLKYDRNAKECACMEGGREGVKLTENASWMLRSSLAEAQRTGKGYDVSDKNLENTRS